MSTEHAAVLHRTHLEAVIVPLHVPSALPILYFLDISSDQKICCKHYQLEHMGKIYKDLPVVFEVKGCIIKNQKSTKSDWEIDDETGAPVVAVASCLVGPCRVDDTEWNRSVEKLWKISQSAPKDVRSYILVPGNEKDQPSSMRFFWCQRRGVCTQLQCLFGT